MLTVEGLRRTFPATKTQAEVRAVDDVSLELKPGELFTMLGPSGCGKTTTLRCVAGLEQPDGGEIRLGDRVLFSSARRIMVDANQRGLGMVFQSYAIWPHMDVFSNTAFPLQVLPWKKRPSRAEIRTRVERVLDVVQLGELAGRPATDLSGGQQQRLALARALVMEPPLLLLDEPLSNLDAKLREGMRFELRRLQRELGVTSVYVTHDQIEALAMSTRIAVMRKGHIEQIGRPREIYGAPATRFVADFIGSANFIEGTVRSVGPAGETVVSTAYGPLTGTSDSSHQVGEKVLLATRPESIALEEAEDGEWVGTVQARAYLGDGVDHIIQMGSQTFRVKTPSNISIHDGTKVRLKFADGACRVVPGSTVSEAIPTAHADGRIEAAGGAA